MHIIKNTTNQNPNTKFDSENRGVILEWLLEEKIQIHKIIEARLRQGMSIKPRTGRHYSGVKFDFFISLL